MTDVILLHGAWHQPAHYDEVVGLLRSQDVSVEVPDLYELSLDESTALVEEIVAASASSPVIVGHSFGGVVAGTVRGASALVLLAGWLLDAGESPMQLLMDVATETGTPPDGLLTTPDDNGRLHLDPADARKKLYGDVDDSTATRALDLLRPEPPTIFAATPTHVTWHDTPTTYITASNDRALPAPLSTRFASRCKTSQTWPTSHSPHLTHPTKVATLIRQHLTSKA